jgi:hypothetical protein
MTDATRQQLAVFAAARVKLGNVEASLKRKLTAEERQEWKRLETVEQLKRAVKAKQPMDSATRNAKLRHATHTLVVPELTAEQRKERKRLEKDVPKWLRHFFPGVFRLPFGKVHREIIAAAMRTIADGGRCVVAAPRGTGKSYVLDGVCLFAVLTGRKRFPVVIPWKGDDIRKAFDFWKKALCFNAELDRLYPEFCRVFRESRGMAQKVPAWHDEEGTLLGARLMVSQGMIVLPGNRGVIGGTTMNGNPLGLHYTTDDGQGLRPDLIFIDDPQDRDTALSRSQRQRVIDMIDMDIAGMAGPDVAMPMMMACTVKQRDDVAEHYLSARTWRGVRVPQVTAWPEGFHDAGSAVRALWEQWNDLRIDGLQSRDGGKGQLAYYRANKKAMTQGMAVSWEHRKISADTPDAPKAPDALYAALHDYFAMGHAAFMSERQNEPVKADASQYELTVADVLAHTLDLPRLAVPSTATVLVAGCDINRSGLHWAMAAFDQGMGCHVVDYGNWMQNGELWPENATAHVKAAMIYRGLAAMCADIAGRAYARGVDRTSPSILLIDASFESDTVHRFCEQARHPFRCYPAIGRAAHRYRWNTQTIVGRPMEQCHIQRPSNRSCPYVMHNADHWREVRQRAMLGEPGEPGGATLFRAPSPGYHVPFAEHLTAERIANKYATDKGMRWEWIHQVGADWDWGDALSYCYVAAAVAGLTTSGIVPTRKRYVEVRKCKVKREM